MTQNASVLPLPESQDEGNEYGKELNVSFLDREMLHANQSSSFVLLIEATGFYINDRTKSAASHTSSFYRLGEQVLQKLYDMHVGSDDF